MYPLHTHSAVVLPAWIDYNDHMTEGFYGVAFADASDAFLLDQGFDADYRKTHRGAFYTVETHIRFLQQLELNDPIVFETLVLGIDARRVHLFHSMLHGEERYLAATQEVLMLHVNRDSVRVASMSDDLLSSLLPFAEAHADVERPEGVGAAVRPVVKS
ncbi:MAG: thioesterase [Acidimicrobiia bacterium]|nr:thioesterase [Acidimicrobiia bacterium]